MMYTNRCTICGNIDNETRPMADYDKPSPCTKCGAITENKITVSAIGKNCL